MGNTLALEELAELTAAPADQLREWRSLGLIGRESAETFRAEDVQRIRLIQLLLRRGIGLAAIARVEQEQGFLSRYIDVMFPAGVRAIYSLAEVNRMLGMDSGSVRRFWEAAGLGDRGDLLAEGHPGPRGAGEPGRATGTALGGHPLRRPRQLHAYDRRDGGSDGGRRARALLPDRPGGGDALGRACGQTDRRCLHADVPGTPFGGRVRAGKRAAHGRGAAVPRGAERPPLGSGALPGGRLPGRDRKRCGTRRRGGAAAPGAGDGPGPERSRRPLGRRVRAPWDAAAEGAHGRSRAVPGAAPG